jgi:hypothetical protein
VHKNEKGAHVYILLSFVHTSTCCIKLLAKIRNGRLIIGVCRRREGGGSAGARRYGSARRGGRVGRRAPPGRPRRRRTAPPAAGRPRRAAAGAGLRWRSRGPCKRATGGREAAAGERASASEPVRRSGGAAGREFTGPRGPISRSDSAVHNVLNDLERKFFDRAFAASARARIRSLVHHLGWMRILSPED